MTVQVYKAQHQSLENIRHYAPV